MVVGIAWHGLAVFLLVVPLAAAAGALVAWHAQTLALHRDAERLMREARAALALAHAAKTYVEIEVAHAERQGVALPPWPEGLAWRDGA